MRYKPVTFFLRLLSKCDSRERHDPTLNESLDHLPGGLLYALLSAVKNHTEYGDTFLGWRGLGLEPFCLVVEGLEGLIVEFGVGDVICAGV
jgi:hypothetical protein